MEQERWYFGAS